MLKLVIEELSTKATYKLLNVEQEIESLSDAVITNARGILAAEGKNSTGTLSDSLSYDITQRENQDIVVRFDMVDYGMFVEEGVQGKVDTSKAPESPFRFGSGSGKAGGLRKGIQGWIKDKPIKNNATFKGKSGWRNKAGQFLSYKSMGFLISRAVYMHGIKPTPFLGQSVEEIQPKWDQKLEVAFAQDLEVYLEKVLPEFKMEFVVVTDDAGNETTKISRTKKKRKKRRSNRRKRR
tara:strand:+ start:333 stop:1043 length:711 start_codon:yes stop_codon:yes gene_type:complete